MLNKFFGFIGKLLAKHEDHVEAVCGMVIFWSILGMIYLGVERWG